MDETYENNPVGWQCSCGTDNAATSRFCSFCGKPRPVTVDSQNPASTEVKTTRLYKPQSFETPDRELKATPVQQRPQISQNWQRPQQSNWHAEQPATHPSQFQGTRPVPPVRKKNKTLRIVLISVLSLVLLLVVFVATYFTTYALAKKAADKRNYEQAEKLLFLNDLTKLHDPDLSDYVRALKSLDTGDYETAIQSFEKLGDYRESEQLRKEAVYRLAEKKREAGKFEDSSALFEGLDAEHFSDSADQILETKYQEAESALQSKDYDAAIALFSELQGEGYKDAADRISDVKYLQAEDALQNKNYDLAITLFSELQSDNYKDAANRVNEANYQKADSLEKAGNHNSALALFKKLADANYGDAATRVMDIRYQDALDLSRQGKITDALSALEDLKSEGYAKASEGRETVLNDVRGKTEGGSYEFLGFWQSEYEKSGDNRDREYYLLSVHNQLSYISVENETSLPPDYEVPGFTSMSDFYYALKNTSFRDRCEDQCYDFTRFIGNWRCSNFSLEVTRTGSGGYMIRSIGNFWPKYPVPAYWKLYNHILAFYRRDDDSKIDDVYYIKYLSDDEMDLYIYKTNQTYRMTK